MAEAPQDITFKKFVNLVRSTDPPFWMLALGISSSIVVTVINLTIPMTLKQLIDQSTQQGFNFSALAQIVFQLLFQLLATYFMHFYLAKFGQYVVAGLRREIWVKMIHLPVSFFDANRSGELASRVVNDSSTIQTTVSTVFSRLVAGSLTAIGVIGLLLFMDWRLTVMMLFAIPLIIVVVKPLGRKIKKNAKSIQEETAAFSGQVQESLSEMRLMKASSAEELEEKKGSQGIEKIYEKTIYESKIFAFLQPFTFMIMVVFFILVLAYGGLRVSAGSLSVGSLVAFVMYLYQIMSPITTFSNFYNRVQQAIGATSRIVEILELDEENGHQLSLTKDIQQHILTFEHVNFHYQANQKILTDVTFEALPGQKTAFVGPSGGGKTTIFSLIERFYQPTSGQIKIGQQNISQLNIKNWRNQLAYVSQENALLSGSIRDNLLYGLEHPMDMSDEDLWEVLELAYAKDFVKEFPDQIDSQIGERGIKLSGGQRQRINIARAFLRNPHILLLDEATASLDSQSEKVVQQALERLMKGRTTLVIAHRLSTITDADRIYVLEDGHITAQGSHQDLLQNSDLYRSYADQQLQ